MNLEVLHYDPTTQPEISTQLECDVPPELLWDFRDTLVQLLDDEGVDGTINDATESYEGRKYTRYDKDGNILFTSRRAESDALTALMQTCTEQGATLGDLSLRREWYSHLPGTW